MKIRMSVIRFHSWQPFKSMSCDTAPEQRVSDGIQRRRLPPTSKAGQVGEWHRVTLGTPVGRPRRRERCARLQANPADLTGGSFQISLTRYPEVANGNVATAGSEVSLGCAPEAGDERGAGLILRF